MASQDITPVGKDSAKVSLLNDPKFRGYIFQAVAVLVIAGLGTGSSTTQLPISNVRAWHRGLDFSMAAQASISAVAHIWLIRVTRPI